VIDSVENDKTAGWFGHEGKIDRSIMLFVQRQPGTNTIKVVDGVKELLPSFRTQMPASVNLDVLIDRSIAIRESVHDVKFTLVLAICLVVLVIFAFLRSLSATGRSALKSRCRNG
jgi:HAE1 family hydrophobic/amphiphilic exporter-1